jgi:hypothetical protein
MSNKDHKSELKIINKDKKQTKQKKSPQSYCKEKQCF